MVPFVGDDQRAAFFAHDSTTQRKRNGTPSTRWEWIETIAFGNKTRGGNCWISESGSNRGFQTKLR